MLSSLAARIYHHALYAHLYIQSCALMSASYLEDRFVQPTDRSS